MENLSKKIIKCRSCPRLVEHRESVAINKVRRYKDEAYWGKPVPGFGDVNAELVIIGLAPAAHGANRTGRMFTGDKSGDWLYRALYESGFASQPESVRCDDGLRLNNTFITALIRCAPPQNKPLRSELIQCQSFLQEEIQLLNNARIYLALGRLAFERYCRLIDMKPPPFGHGKLYHTPDNRYLIASYHPSRQNTQTGKLKWDAWLAIFQTANRLLNS